MLESEAQIVVSLIKILCAAEQHIESISPPSWNGEYNKKAALDDINYAKSLLELITKEK